MSSARTLKIEGWRHIPHSYAIINAFQCQQLLTEPNLQIRHQDVQYFFPTWKPSTGTFSPDLESALSAIPTPPPDEKFDAVYRISYPYNISPSTAGRTVVYGTAEYSCVPLQYITGMRYVKDAMDSCDAIIVTPSNWSRDGFISAGADPSRVVVIPNGFDPQIFRPLPDEERTAMRAGVKDYFTFLSLGAMTGNKGMAELLKAFAVVCQKHPHVRLVLKGMGELYESRKYLQLNVNQLTQSDAALIQSRVTYVDKTLSFTDMSRLYQLADVYISPYKGEGFNMPVLEAAACGIPVICTAGGATEDFITDDFALRINARRVPEQQSREALGWRLEVDMDHLIHQMTTALETPEIAIKARATAPGYVGARYTWHHVSAKLLKVLFDPRPVGQGVPA